MILICNSLLSPVECKENGKDVTSVIGEAQRTPFACLTEGQTKIASLAFSPKLGDNFYVKIKCIPKNNKELGE